MIMLHKHVNATVTVILCLVLVVNHLSKEVTGLVTLVIKLLSQFVQAVIVILTAVKRSMDF